VLGPRPVLESAEQAAAEAASSRDRTLSDVAGRASARRTDRAK